jgi:hypothetical protein
MSLALVNARLASFTPVACLPLLLGVVPGLASVVGVAAFSALGVGYGAGVKVDGVSEPRMSAFKENQAVNTELEGLKQEG